MALTEVEPTAGRLSQSAGVCLSLSENCITPIELELESETVLAPRSSSADQLSVHFFFFFLLISSSLSLFLLCTCRNRRPSHWLTLFLRSHGRSSTLPAIGIVGEHLSTQHLHTF